jgi:LysM repeat protein
MKKRTTALARVVAFTALVAAFLVVVVVVSNSLEGNGSSGEHHLSGQPQHQHKKVHAPATYVIQNGDTLTAIAHKTGVSVVRIETLNPEVDPQILISGQKLKLR